MTTERPERESDVDDLGLTHDEWHDIAMDYYFSNTEPAEGSVEAEAFKRLDAFSGARTTVYTWRGRRTRRTSDAGESRSLEGRLPLV